MKLLVIKMMTMMTMTERTEMKKEMPIFYFIQKNRKIVIITMKN